MNPSNNEIQVSSLKEAQEAIYIIRGRIKLREQDLELRLKRLPKETLKAGTGLILPVFLNNFIASRSWKILKDVINLLSSKNTDKASLWKDIAKQAGFVGLLKSVGGLFKRSS